MDKVNDWSNELEELKAILNKTGLEITIKWGSEVYTHNGKNIVSLGGFKNFFTLWFYNGVFLKDKYKMLLNAQENKTKALRQWRFTSINEIDEKKILEYVKEAIKNSENGIELKPEKFSPVPVPQLLADKLKKDKALKAAFSALTPGKQKEYSLYIDEAKQEATKTKRVEKIVPQILKGIGLNNKYK